MGEETEKTANFIKSSICFCIVVFFPFNAEYERKQCIADLFKRIDRIISV